jgi:hypothetical protein
MGSEGHEKIVLDGQQRLATAVIFFSAVRNWLGKYSEYRKDADKIDTWFIGRSELGQSDAEPRIILNSANHQNFLDYVVKSVDVSDLKKLLAGLGATHFGAGFVGCEHPIDAGAGGVALTFPGSDLGFELLLRVDASVEALAAQHSDFDLDHVEPTCVLWGVVELQSSQNAPGFGGRECLVGGAGSSSPLSPARQFGLRCVISGCIRTADIPAG